MAEGTLTADEVPPARADDPDYGDFHRIDAVYVRPHGEFLVGIHEGQIVAMACCSRHRPSAQRSSACASIVIISDVASGAPF
jgi:hypothetical protein